RKHRGTVLAEPVCDGYGGADGSANEKAFAAARESTDEHSAASAHADFGEIFGVVAVAFELPFGVDVGAAAGVGVNQRSVQHEPVSIGKDKVFGEDGDGGPAGNAPRLIRFRDATLDSRADRNHGFSVHYDGFSDSGRERVSGLRTEGCERGFELHLDGGAGGQGS